MNLFRADPVTTFVGFLLGLLNIYVAIGQPGVHCLNRIFGRFDQEREITLTPGGVKIQQGTQIRQKKWNEFRSYFESHELYVLQTKGAMFWTTPNGHSKPASNQFSRGYYKAISARKKTIPVGNGASLQAPGYRSFSSLTTVLNWNQAVGVAQLVERRSVAPNVAGSNPVSHPKFTKPNKNEIIGRLATI